MAWPDENTFTALSRWRAAFPGHGLARRPVRGLERSGQDLENRMVADPLALRCRPVQGVGVLSVRQDVAVQDVGEDAIAVVGELPVGGFLGLRVMDRHEAYPVVARVRSPPAGFLLLPVGQRAGLRVV